MNRISSATTTSTSLAQTRMRLPKQRRTSIPAAGRFGSRGWFISQDLHDSGTKSRWPIEERIYRMRCVEAWSMVIPWAGLQLSHLSMPSSLWPKPSTLHSKRSTTPSECLVRKPLFSNGLMWRGETGRSHAPSHLLAVGLYGKDCLLRMAHGPSGYALEYGFKGIKSIVKIYSRL